jgi:hypothetical protein
LEFAFSGNVSADRWAQGDGPKPRAGKLWEELMPTPGVRKGFKGTAPLYAAWAYYRMVDRMPSGEAMEKVSKRFGITVKSLSYLCYRENWNALLKELLPAIWVRRTMRLRESERQKAKMAGN